ncbi:hypothetical protein DSO57_1036804 [Entomophthora muscae]|uniref:Uncharacterized protein n=1 Tax=Entomophthora muscae TaxID=34485 RepID=A0ACC2SN35_9FUNG|nr:hypothetical protein DSO57_1036804 [Entomophthora muscae]
MKLIVVAWLPPLGVVIGTPLSALISLAQSVSLGGPSSSASACGGLTPEKRGRAALRSIGLAAWGNPGSRFNSRSWAWVSRGGELSILTQKQAPKPKKETEPSAAKDESYLVESMTAVRTNVAQKHRLSHIVYPYNTPEKQKGAKAAKPQQTAPDAHLPNQAPPVAPETEQANNTQSAQQTDYEAQPPEPFGIPIDEEDGTYPVEPTIEVTKGTSSKTTLKKPKVKLPLLPQVNPPKLNVLKILADTQVLISLYNLAEIAPSVRAQMVYYLGAIRVRDPEEQFAVTEEKPQDAQKVSDIVSKGAPRIDGEVEGHPTAIILDRESTSNIISESFLKLLGIQEYSKVKEKVTFANDKTEECLGAVRDLTIEICGVDVLISAAIFALTRYNLLLGRHALSDFGVTISFCCYSWFIERNNKLIPIDDS